MEAENDTEEVIVIGAGPGGLAVAGALKKSGIDALVIDKAAAVGVSWRRHYERLHLHTVRWLSGLPGFAIPRSYGRWVSRDGLVAYLEEYARRLQLNVRLETAAERLDEGPEGWRLQTSGGSLAARTVVVATGYNHLPMVPQWPGREAFTGAFIHSAEYANGRPYKGRDVLVVGLGNSGAEIAVDLVEAGARRVYLSVRTPPNIQRRAILGLPIQLVGVVVSKLPGPVIDRLSLAMQARAIGSLEEFGLPAPTCGVHTRVVEDEQIPVIDVGFLASLKRGEVAVVPCVEGFEGGEVLLAGRRRLKVDAVVAATGYRRGLEGLVGHLGVLKPNGRPLVNGADQLPERPGLYFIGYTNPLGGNLREMAKDASRIAARVSASGRLKAV